MENELLSLQADAYQLMTTGAWSAFKRIIAHKEKDIDTKLKNLMFEDESHDRIRLILFMQKDILGKFITEVESYASEFTIQSK